MLNAAKSECSSVESLADSERVCGGGGGGAEQRPRQAESEEVSCKFDGLLLPGGLQTKPDTYQAVLNCYVAVLKTPLLMVHPSLAPTCLKHPAWRIFKYC